MGERPRNSFYTKKKFLVHRPRKSSNQGHTIRTCYNLGRWAAANATTTRVGCTITKAGDHCLVGPHRYHSRGGTGWTFFYFPQIVPYKLCSLLMVSPKYFFSQSTVLSLLSSSYHIYLSILVLVWASFLYSKPFILSPTFF